MHTTNYLWSQIGARLVAPLCTVCMLTLQIILNWQVQNGQKWWRWRIYAPWQWHSFQYIYCLANGNSFSTLLLYSKKNFLHKRNVAYDRLPIAYVSIGHLVLIFLIVVTIVIVVSIFAVFAWSPAYNMLHPLKDANIPYISIFGTAGGAHAWMRVPSCSKPCIFRPLCGALLD